MSPTPATRPSAGVRAISSSLVAPPLLGGEHQRPVLDERALVDEVGEVLAGGPAPALVALGDRVGAGLVERRARGARGRPRGPRALVGVGSAARRCSRARRLVAGLRARRARWPSSTVSPTSPRAADHAAVLRRSPRAPSSSPRAPRARSRRATGSSALMGDRDHGAGERRASDGRSSAGAYAIARDRLEDLLGRGVVARVLGDVRTGHAPPGAITSAPPSCAVCPSVLAWTLPVFAVVISALATTLGPNSSPRSPTLAPAAL